MSLVLVTIYNLLPKDRFSLVDLLVNKAERGKKRAILYILQKESLIGRGHIRIVSECKRKVERITRACMCEQ